jgi:hypothetical protein
MNALWLMDRKLSAEMNIGRKSIILIAAIAALLQAAAFIACGGSHPNSFAAGTIQEIAAARPLAEAAKLLEQKYGKAITYEDPPSMFIPYKTLPGLPLPELPHFKMFLPETPAKVDAALLEKIVADYQHQTNGAQFKVLTSRWGLHVLPVRIRDGSGRWVQAASLLDVRIDVPTTSRTPSSHLDAICAAVTRSSGIKLQPLAPYPDEAYAPNGKVLPRGLPPDGSLMTDKMIEQISFVWGTTGTNAREAIITLLEKSATTMSWQVQCQAGEGCYFGLRHVSSVYDRSGKWPTVIETDPELRKAVIAEQAEMKQQGYSRGREMRIGPILVSSYSAAKGNPQLIKINLIKENALVNLATIRGYVEVINPMTGTDINKDGVPEIIIDECSAGNCAQSHTISVYQVKAGKLIEMVRKAPRLPDVIKRN